MNNTFTNNTIVSNYSFYLNGTGTSQAIDISTNTSVWNNNFINNTLRSNNAGSSSYIVISGNVTNQFFINNTINISNIIFISRNDSPDAEKQNITIQWYLSINVTNSTNNNFIANATVIINDSFNNNIFNGTTNPTGGIPTQIFTEFTMNGSVPFNNATDTCTDVRNNPNITCFTPYNISVNITGYNSLSSSVDINRSKFLNLSMSLSTVTNSCTYTSGDWNVLCSDNCVISSPVNVGGNNIYITGTGTMTINSPITNFKRVRIQGTSAANRCLVICNTKNCFRT